MKKATQKKYYGKSLNPGEKRNIDQSIQNKTAID